MTNRVLMYFIMFCFSSVGMYAHNTFTGGYSGSPGAPSCASSCHGTTAGTLTVTGFPQSYVPGQTYRVVVGHNGGSKIVNFNLTTRIGSSSSVAGTFAPVNNSTLFTGADGGVYANPHAIDSAVFAWTAPSQGTGAVNLYASGFQGVTTSSSGDSHALTLSASEQAISVPPPAPTLVSPLNVSNVPVLAGFAWNSSTGASTYNLQVSLNSGFTTTVLNQTGISSTSFTLTTPLQKGTTYYWRVNAANAGGTSAWSQILSFTTVTVLPAGGKGTIAGIVTDSTGIPIVGVLVEAFKIDSSTTNVSSYSASSDMQGQYRIADVAVGNYKLHATPGSLKYLSQWYSGAENVTLATTVVVSDSPAVAAANFKLRSNQTQTSTITVQGRVLDTLGHAITSVHPQVYFVAAGSLLTDDEEKDDMDSPSAFHTIANDDGSYSITLPAGSYIAYASARGYVTEYYLHQTDVRTASVLNVQSNLSGISFTLASLPRTIVGSISGSVLSRKDQIGVRSRVIATRINFTTTSRYSARSSMVNSDSLGNYQLNNLVAGTYIVQAFPFGGYAPTYYTGDTTGTRWAKATKLAVNGNTITGINILVTPIEKRRRGYSEIDGSVRTQTGTPLQGAFVYAAVQNSIQGFGIVDGNGNYQISGLSPNLYTVTVDMPGYAEPNAQTTAVSYLESGTPVYGMANFSVTSQVTAVEKDMDPIPENFSLNQNYPNPFNPSTMIQYALVSPGVVSLKVYNLLGQEVATLASGYQNAGTYKVIFNAKGLAGGVYLYRLQTQGSEIARKMILLQ